MNNQGKVITRFAPSPTGFMHLGNARTALFNWLFAKHHGGKFLLRIEDTDRERYSKEAVDIIYNDLSWLGIDWDNQNAPSQYECKDRHIEIANLLLEQGKAYKCYCSPEELDEMREKAKAEGAKVFYNRKWRDRDEKDAPVGVKPVIRIKAPLEGTSIVEDRVQGKVEVSNEHIDDFILLRSDGSPTYMLAVVVDDHDMGITHILRGDDHLNNTFRQKVIFDALGWKTPIYAHLPLIHGNDGGKLSKRHGAQSVGEYKELGYLPEALANQLLKLGWGHGDDEIISMQQAIEWFDFAGIGKAAARFDAEKLLNLNAHYIKHSDNNRLTDMVEKEFEKRCVNISNNVKNRILGGMNDLKDRSKTILQLTDEAMIYLEGEPKQYEEKAAKNLDKNGLEMLSHIIDVLSVCDKFEHDEIENILRKLSADKAEGKLGKVMMPLRAALTGKANSPSVFSIVEILGKEETIARINKAISNPPSGV